MTSITITDPALLAQFTAAAGVIELKAPDGRIVAIIRPSEYPGLPPGANPPPLSDAERAALREQARRPGTRGLSLDEVWKEVDRRLGGQ